MVTEKEMNEVGEKLIAARKINNVQEVKRLEATWNSLNFQAAKEAGGESTSGLGWWWQAYSRLRKKYGVK